MCSFIGIYLYKNISGNGHDSIVVLSLREGEIRLGLQMGSAQLQTGVSKVSGKWKYFLNILFSDSYSLFQIDFFSGSF